jgi:hypothetical protein
MHPKRNDEVLAAGAAIVRVRFFPPCCSFWQCSFYSSSCPLKRGGHGDGGSVRWWWRERERSAFIDAARHGLRFPRAKKLLDNNRSRRTTTTFERRHEKCYEANAHESVCGLQINSSKKSGIEQRPCVCVVWRRTLPCSQESSLLLLLLLLLSNSPNNAVHYMDGCHPLAIFAVWTRTADTHTHTSFSSPALPRTQGGSATLSERERER